MSHPFKMKCWLKKIKIKQKQKHKIRYYNIIDIYVCFEWLQSDERQTYDGGYYHTYYNWYA